MFDCRVMMDACFKVPSLVTILSENGHCNSRSLNGGMWALNKGSEVECFILCILWSMERKTEMSLLLCSSWAIFQLLHHLFHKLVFMYPIIIFLILRCLPFLIFFNIKGDIPSFSIWGDFPPFRLFMFWVFHHSIILCCRVTNYVRTLTINCYWKEYGCSRSTIYSIAFWSYLASEIFFK